MYTLYDIALVVNISLSYALWITLLRKLRIKNIYVFVFLTSILYLVPIIHYLLIENILLFSIPLSTWLVLYAYLYLTKNRIVAIITPLPLILSLVYYLLVD